MGEATGKSIFALINLPQPRPRFDKYQDKALELLKKISGISMNNAANELIEFNNGNNESESSLEDLKFGEDTDVD